jgi:hypothetical protein
MGALKDRLHKDNPSSYVQIGSRLIHLPDGVLSTVRLYSEARRDRRTGNFEEAQIKYSALGGSEGLLKVFNKKAERTSFKMFKKAMEKRGEVKYKEAMDVLDCSKEITAEQKRAAVELLLESAWDYTEARNGPKAARTFERVLLIARQSDEFKDILDQVMVDIAQFNLIHAQGSLDST